MKRFFTRVILVCLLLFFFGNRASAVGFLKNWVNTSGGNWFDPNNWSPSVVPTNGDLATITNIGTYTVFAPTGQVTCAALTIGGASGKQTFVYGSPTGGQLLMTNSTILNNGVLVLTNGGLTGSLLVKPGGELDFNSQFGMPLYSLALTNQGTVMWSSGSLSTGGTFPAYTYITNSGLWQISAADGQNMGSGGGNISFFYNSGTVQKTSGTGANSISITFLNLPTGTVNVTSGTLTLSGEGTNSLDGTFTATSPGLLKFSGNETDAGGTMSGTGAFQFTSGNLYLRTNVNPQLKLMGGDIYITDTTTFQQAGAITNMTLDGSNLHGTNRIAGTMTVNSGYAEGQITVLPGAQLVYAGYSVLYYTTLLMNLGTVTCDSSLAFCGTPPTVVSNGGIWNLAGDGTMGSGGVGTGAFTNAGMVQKTVSGGASSSFAGFPFVNLPSGIIRVAVGTLLMPANYTNVAGEVQLAGGTFGVNSTTNGMTGGILEGAGTNSTTAVFDSGTVSPGPGASSLIRFNSGLTLGTNVTLVIDGTGTVPGVSYDQLSVGGGPVAISNATLQVTSLPSVPVGTTFVIITNITANPTVGNFNGLPENAQFTISGQPFRIHYSGGDGNDVVLVRDSGAGGGPQLSSGGYTNKTFKLLGVGGGSTIYTIQASTNFLQWTNVGLATGDVGGNFIFTDTNAPNFRYRFYRTTN